MTKPPGFFTLDNDRVYVLSDPLYFLISFLVLYSVHL